MRAAFLVNPVMIGLVLTATAATETARADMLNVEDLEAWESCALCHGVEGVSAMPKFPVLAGQKLDYLQAQARNFRVGKRTNDGGQMEGVLAELSDKELLAALTWFSRARPVRAPSDDFDADLYERGRRVFQGNEGNAAGCVTCHANPDSPAPWLFRQHQDYLRKQLEDFRMGRRVAHDSALMPEIARQLTQEQVDAVTYFAAHTEVPGDVRKEEKSMQADTRKKTYSGDRQTGLLQQ